jgi:hypothetical protein
MNLSFASASALAQPPVDALLRWQEPLATRLRHRHELPGRVANRLLNVELGLFLLADLLPCAPAEALPNLLNRQGAVYRERPVWTPRQHRQLVRASALLAPYQNRTLWLDALARYDRLPARIRLFDLTGRSPQLCKSGLQERVSLFGRVLA